MDRFTFSARVLDGRLAIEPERLLASVLASCRDGQRLIVTLQVRDDQKLTTASGEATPHTRGLSESVRES